MVKKQQMALPFRPKKHSTYKDQATKILNLNSHIEKKKQERKRRAIQRAIEYADSLDW